MPIFSTWIGRRRLDRTLNRLFQEHETAALAYSGGADSVTVS